MPEKKRWKTKLTVLSMDVEFEGFGKESGNPFTIYNVEALGEDGLPVEKRLRTFDGELPLNELVEYDVEERPDERHGTTYTLSIPGKRSSGSTGGGVKGELERLVKRLDQLESRLIVLEAGGKSGPQSLATPPADAGGTTI